MQVGRRQDIEAHITEHATMHMLLVAKALDKVFYVNPWALCPVAGEVLSALAYPAFYGPVPVPPRGV